MNRKLSDQLLEESQLFDEIKAFVIDCSYASISVIQRKFKLGFNRVVRIVDKLEKTGIIAPINDEGIRLSQVITNEQQKWWDNLPDVWKRVFIIHLYDKPKRFLLDHEWNEDLGNLQLREKTDLIKIFCLTEIWCSNNKLIVDLPDLRYFHRLRDLSIRYARIRDISKLADCQSLVNVDLSGNEIEDIAPLCALYLLERVNLVGNPFEDLELEAELIARSNERRKFFDKYRDIIEEQSIQMEKFYDC
ncbi:DNA translocase FtsK [Bisgaard Taxon 46]